MRNGNYLYFLGTSVVKHILVEINIYFEKLKLPLRIFKFLNLHKFDFPLQNSNKVFIVFINL